MSISCDCSLSDFDGPDFYDEIFPVARKKHICCECDSTIEPGQKYQRFEGLWHGKFSTYKTCMACYRIRERYCPHGYTFTDLIDQLNDCLGFDYREVPDDDEEDGE